MVKLDFFTSYYRPHMILQVMDSNHLLDIINQRFVISVTLETIPFICKYDFDETSRGLIRKSKLVYHALSLLFSVSTAFTPFSFLSLEQPSKLQGRRN